MSGSVAPGTSLAMLAVSKRFGQTAALDAASLSVRAGTLHALVGENGAGKSTLMRIAFGMVRADAGTVQLNGLERRFRSSADAIAAGIGMVHQHFLLVNAMTVAENVALGDVPVAGTFGRYDPQATAARVRAIGEESGLHLDPCAFVGGLSVAAQQRLEIVKALARRARFLVLDEPTAVLSPNEGAELYRWLRVFVNGGGTAVVVTHRLRDALENADDVTVLRRGKTVLAAPTQGLVEPTLVRAMLGEQAVPSEIPNGAREPVRGDSVLRIEDVTVVDSAGVTRLRRASFDARAGEVVGIVGLEGSGSHELIRTLAGRLVPSSGRVTRPAAVGFVPEDRLQDALIPELSLVENVALVGAGAARGRLRWKELARRTSRLVAAFEVVTRGPWSKALELSGGNQQKFVLARELSALDRALVVENPTRGLDVRAAARVTMEVIRAARERGAVVVFYSSDYEEVLAIADRVYSCFAGTVRELGTKDPQLVAGAMVGAA